MVVKAVIFDRLTALIRERTSEQVLAMILRPAHPEIKAAAFAHAQEASRAWWRAHAKDLPRGERWSAEIRLFCLQAALDDLHLPGDTEDDLQRLDQCWDAFRIEGLYAGVHPCLTALSALHLSLGVLAQSLRSSIEIRAELERLGIARHFEAIISVEDLDWDKPDPRTFQTVAEKLKAPPNETLFIGGDYEVDALGARSAGMTPVLVDRKGVQQTHTDVTRIPNLAALPSLIASMQHAVVPSPPSSGDPSALGP